MGVFEHFPYTNFHELNLSWILAKLKELEDVIGNQIVDIVARAGVAANAEAISDLSDRVDGVETTATGAAATAQSASTTAQSAVTTANAANTAASAAVNTADSANTIATAAQSGVNALSDALSAHSIRYADHTFSNITIPSTHYANLGDIRTNFGTPAGAYHIMGVIRGWTSAPNALSLGLSSNGNDLYVFCPSTGTIGSVSVRFWYTTGDPMSAP